MKNLKSLKMVFIGMLTLSVMTSCEKEDLSNFENEEFIITEESIVDENEVSARAQESVKVIFNRCFSSCGYQQKVTVDSGGGGFIKGKLNSNVNDRVSYVKIINPYTSQDVKVELFENANFTGKKQTIRFNSNGTRTFSVNGVLFDKASSFKISILNN